MQNVRTRLSVNLNKVALIRNSRGGNRPDVISVARDCERFGADGITVHPRPDERHIRFDDLPQLKEVNSTEFNVEGYPSDRFMKAVLACRPDQVTLVPDAPDALTSSSGWDTINEKALLKDVIIALRESSIRTSLFLDPLPEMVAAAADCGTDRIELYTGKYANDFKINKLEAVRPHVEAAEEALRCGLGVNAGHDLDLTNLSWYRQHLPHLLEVSIGHALISDALYFGLENVIPMYKRKLEYVNR